jgi:LysR family glycine cleavage system transcriptional activator
MVDNSNWLPSFNALRAFEVVARLGSFQKAAEELNVTSPAVQQQVRGLEQSLQKQLVTRGGRAIAITAAGKDAAQLLKEGFDRIALAVETIRARDRRNEIKVSVEPSFASLWLISRLAKFTELNSVEVSVEPTNRLADLSRGEADVAIRYTSRAPHDHRRLELFEDETIVVCSPQLAASVEKKKDAQKLEGQTFIHFVQSGGAHYQLDWFTWMQTVLERPSTPKSNLRFTDYAISLQAAIAGQGFALASKPLVQTYLAQGLLVSPIAKSYKNGFGYYVLTANGSGSRAGADAFISWLCAEASGPCQADLPNSNLK